MKTKLFVFLLFIVSFVSCSDEVIEIPRVTFTVCNTANNQTVVVPSIDTEVHINFLVSAWANQINITPSEIVIKENNVVEAHVGDKLLFTTSIGSTDGNYTVKYSFSNDYITESKEKDTHFREEYIVPELQPGDYSIKCSVHGVQKSSIMNLPDIPITIRVLEP